MSNSEPELPLDIEAQKQKFEDDVMRQIDELYPEKERSVIAAESGINIVSCGETPTSEQLQPVLNGLIKIRSVFGNDAEKVFNGLDILMVNGIVPGGGQALGRKNVVIIDTSKTTMTLTEMEDMLDEKGEYRKGDRSKLVDNSDEISATTLDVVHELGHILEFKSHGDYDIGFGSLESSESPTEYGSKNPREDYAESWMYLVFGGELDKQRRSILLNDFNDACRE